MLCLKSTLIFAVISTEELKAAKAAPAPTIAEQMAPSAEEAAATATHAKIAQGAYDHIVNGTAPEPPPMPDRVEAVSTKHLRGNDALRTYGRPRFPRIKDPVTGKMKALEDGGENYITRYQVSRCSKRRFTKKLYCQIFLKT